MKIHIVQKGDTLWEISKKYGVDFEELKGLNSQLSSPDMIMPGMKIKVPGSAKAVKKETVAIKETQQKETQKENQKENQKETVKQPYMNTSPKPMPAIKEDDTKAQKPVQPQMPVPALPQMPMMEQDISNHTTINFPQMPQMPQILPAPLPEKIEAKKPENKKPENKKPETKKKDPGQNPAQQQTGKQPTYQQPAAEQPIQSPPPHMVPVYWHYCHPCWPAMPFHHPAYPIEGQMEPAYPMMPQVAPATSDCGCQGSSPLVPYPADQGMNAMAGSYPNQGSFGNMYPPQIQNPQETDYYPSPPTFPNFSGLRKENEEKDHHE